MIITILEGRLANLWGWGFYVLNPFDRGEDSRRRPNEGLSKLSFSGR
jgi:hypothetical protein